jgi:hypothetical protein
VPGGTLAVALALCGCGTLSALDPFPGHPRPVAAERPVDTDPALATLPVAVQATSPATAQTLPVAAKTMSPVTAQGAVEDGRYAGLSILTAFHGDCNAGGTGEIVVRGQALSYQDARNPALSGLLGADGSVDLESGGTHLTGRFEAMVFTGRIAGGPCEYQMRFEHVAG